MGLLLTGPFYLSSSSLYAFFIQTGLTALHMSAHCGQTDFVREMLTLVPATLKSENPEGGDSGLQDLATEVSFHLFGL